MRIHRDDPAAAELVQPDLTFDQGRLLASGLSGWGGSLRPGLDVIVAMGFSDVDDFDSTRDRMIWRLLHHELMSRLDWTRALVATEIVFISDVVGGALHWESESGLYEETTLRLLRETQASLSRFGALVTLQQRAREHKREMN